jgi:tetratricopeptide (TPR) repeat protein
MKKVVLASVLAFATSTFCAVPFALAQEQITIKDPAELNTYQNAIGTADPKAKAAALEDFLTKYPQTVLKEQVLNLLLGTYQSLNDQPNMIKTAKRLLDADPTNLRAAFAYVFLTKAQATAKAASDPAAAQPMLDDAAAVAQKALQVTAPSPASGVSAADFAKLKAATTPIFESAIATDDVGKKDYKAAVAAYLEELKSYPDLGVPAGQLGINETYLLGQAYISEDPKDLPSGIFYLERAAQYAPASAKDQVEKAAEYWYQKYHGSMDGFDAVKQLAHDNATPPATYAITPAPPPPDPAVLAHQALYPTSGPPTDIKTMALGDKEYVLANGNQADADAVWATMKGTRVQVPGTVILATADSVQLAVSPDAQQTKTADFTVNFTKPLTDVPTIGSSVKYDATFDSYTKTPPMIILNDGAVPEVPKAPVHRKPSAHR